MQVLYKREFTFNILIIHFISCAFFFLFIYLSFYCLFVFFLRGGYEVWFPGTLFRSVQYFRIFMCKTIKSLICVHFAMFWWSWNGFISGVLQYLGKQVMKIKLITQHSFNRDVGTCKQVIILVYKSN